MQSFDCKLFEQPAPALPDPWTSDWMLRGLLSQHLPEAVHDAAEPALKSLGELSAGELHAFQLADRLNEEFGFSPMVAGLFDTQPFWFYMVLESDGRTVQVPLPDNLKASALRSAIESGLETARHVRDEL